MINAYLFSIGHIFLSGIANHLWQSTLFAAAAWLVTIFLKKNRARIRYWIWFSVTVKFLIPFSLFMNLGSMVASEWVKTPVMVPPEWNVIQTINQPFNPPVLESVSPEIDITGASPLSGKTPLIILFPWLFGVFAILLNWHKRVMRVSRLARKAEPLIDSHRIDAFHRGKQGKRISNAVRLASTRDAMEPGVYGIFRPVLLLPVGILEHVNDSELEAILLHEFEHIRCKDNLIASIHMIVQALFWFHPIVWFTGSRLVFERELACDESVLRSGKNPGVYAEGILKVCEYCFKSPLVCVSGIVGSDLKKRIEGIMKNRTGCKMSMVKRFLLTTAGLAVLGVPLMLGILNAPHSQGRSLGNKLNEYNVDKYKPGSYQVSGKPEMNKKSSEIINKKPVQSSLSAVSNTGTTSWSELSDEPVLKNESSAIVMADAGIQMAEAPEKKTESFKAVQETLTNTDTKGSIAVAKREAPVRVTSGEGISDIEHKNEVAGTFISRGISSLKKGQLEDAFSDFNRAVELDPANPVAYVARGSAYFRLDQLDNAISDYSRAIELNPNLAAAYQNRGSVYSRRNRFDDAISDYNRAIEINPDLAAAYLDRGSIYQLQNRFEDAISDYNKSLELNAEDALIYNRRGLAYFSQEEYQKAFVDFNTAIALYPEDVDAHIYRGYYFQVMGMYNKAVTDYKKALELDPESTVARRLLNEVASMAKTRDVKAIDEQKKECRTQKVGRIIREVCKTKEEWDDALKFINDFKGSPGYGENSGFKRY